MQFIRVNGEPIPIKITPKELEGLIEVRTNQKGERKKINYFKTNPLQIIKILCNTYKVKFELIRNYNEHPGKPTNSDVKCVKLLIHALDINLTAYGRSIRKAIRRMAFKLHFEYCCKIIEFEKIPIKV